MVTSVKGPNDVFKYVEGVVSAIHHITSRKITITFYPFPDSIFKVEDDDSHEVICSYNEKEFFHLTDSHTLGDDIYMKIKEYEKMSRYKNQWKVPSSSLEKKYTVSEDYDGNFSCSCLAWTLQRKECKHIRGVKNGDYGVISSNQVKEETIEVLQSLKLNAKWSLS